jgi:hypothetical protein
MIARIVPPPHTRPPHDRTTRAHAHEGALPNIFAGYPTQNSAVRVGEHGEGHGALGLDCMDDLTVAPPLQTAVPWPLMTMAVSARAVEGRDPVTDYQMLPEIQLGCEHCRQQGCDTLALCCGVVCEES